METIRIKCPNCGAILTVADSPANESKTLKCPVCKITNPFTRYKSVAPRVSEEEDRTNLAVNLVEEDRTCLPDFQRAETIGYLWDSVAKVRYQLSPGINVIGRMTYQSAPAATVPITTEDRGFSRKHMNIEVAKGSDMALRYYIFNAENKNPTSVNGIQINGSDRIVLHNDDVIKSSNTELIFKVE